MNGELIARLITAAWWLLAGFWLGLLIAGQVGAVHVPVWALPVLTLVIWVACRCPKCALPVFYRPSGLPGRFRIRWHFAPPDRACPRCGMRFKARKPAW
ncbi:hypothetical protein [Caulobacter sp. 17J65-9]|uniref:hypothetical protein n=1 Tax=Caulobacter sp. 17J65-9 TaxID=2709382 RepID=UPI0013C6085A|nr:hypothetical protein [Caulobacter sp. 17J65-9]NEX92310.1 hypothetical protein [Caulobacter sp. 17J65-9]